ncbi:hypothetical protein VTJ04DRAFT_8573 [Mycothermus thermophilus]|uniref:uncharacterized protein n=1 Tax=Humicola insolens TaxID=85995 RepID=UPI003742E84D
MSHVPASFAERLRWTQEWKPSRPDETRAGPHITALGRTDSVTSATNNEQLECPVPVSRQLNSYQPSPTISKSRWLHTATPSSNRTCQQACAYPALHTIRPRSPLPCTQRLGSPSRCLKFHFEFHQTPQ